MALIKIFSTKQSRANSKTNVFLEGKKIILSWNAECVSEIEETLLIELLKIDTSVQILDQQVQKKVEASQVSVDDVVKLKERVMELENENQKLRDENEKLKSALESVPDTDNDIEDILGKMKLAELKEFAKENNLPEDEWKGYKQKQPFVQYLLDKVKHQ